VTLQQEQEELEDEEEDFEHLVRFFTLPSLDEQIREQSS